MRKTKIICTIGPASESPEVFKAMCLQGLNVARLNFSHGSHEEHQKKIDMIKAVREELNLPIAIMLDTKGPEYRIRTFRDGKITLRDGDRFTFTTRDLVGDESIVSVSYAGLIDDLSVGDRILVNNGLVIFEVEELAGDEARCRVITGGHAIGFLPLNHIYERSMNYHYQYKGISTYYAESLGTIQQNMQEIQADGFCAVPRVLEMVYDKLYAAGKDFRGMRKRIYDWAFAHGKRYDYTLVKKVSLYQLAQWFLDKAVYSKWREKFGGKRLTVITGGSSIQPKMVRLFAAAGINIYEGYGLSETSPVIAVNDPAHHMVKIGTVGPILSGVEMKFDEDGEILTRGPHVMLGYYKDPEYTAQVIDKDGWFHTGDIGELVSGRYLKITDRKKDIFKLSAGKYVAPQLIENMLRGSEYIDQVMVIGENEKQTAAIISPNFNTLHYWALKHKMHYRDNVELITLPQVLERIRKELDEYNKSLAPHEQIKQFRLVTDEWTPNNGLLSPTLKLRRAPLMEKYKSLVADIYGREKASSSGLFSAFKSIELPTMPWGKKN